MLKCVIIDDEERARNGLKKILETYVSGVEVAGMADNASSGVAKIREVMPDLVFLDVDMPGGDGFQVLNEFQDPDFEVIFVTAYEQYAIKAIRYAALDYLMKPVDLEELIEAVDRVGKRNDNQVREKQFEMLHTGLRDGKLSRLAVPTGEGMTFLNLDEVVTVDSEGSYSVFKLSKGEKVWVSRNLGEYETLLEVNGFYRIHHSHLINLKHVARYIKGRGGYVVMTDGQHLDVSVRRKDGFLEAIKAIS